MAKIKKAVLVLLVCSIGLMAAFLFVTVQNRDTEPPVIRCPDSVLEGSIHLTQEALLADVSAQDNRDGTVEALVESMSPITADRQRTVTYAAADRAGNVGRAKRVVSCPDYQPPRFEFSQALRLPSGSSVYPLLEGIRATDALGEDLTARVRFSILSNSSISSPGLHTLELRLTDSFGYNLVLSVEMETYLPSEERIGVTLKEYLVYLPQNAPFSPMDYFGESTIPGTITVDSEVNTAIPGVYHVEYTVEGENQQVGRSRLVVIVEEQGRSHG